MDNVNPKKREMTGWYTEIRGALFGKNVPLSKEQFERSCIGRRKEQLIDPFNILTRRIATNIAGLDLL